MSHTRSRIPIPVPNTPTLARTIELHSRHTVAVLACLLGFAAAVSVAGVSTMTRTRTGLDYTPKKQ